MPSNPSISKVRAIVTTQWGKTGYRPITFRAISSYFVDSALDNDSDTWNLAISDPHGQYLEVFQRDAEVRVQIFGVGAEGTNYIMTGIADNVGYDDQGSITIDGRDYSSLAVDSTVPPFRWRKRQGWKIIEAQAHELGFPKLDISHHGKIHNSIVTDGSESYWTLWYRMMRKDKQFLWCEPDGKLVGDNLNFANHPVYFFGTPRKDDPPGVRSYYLPVERLEITKGTQRRVDEVWVFGQKGEIGFLERVNDPHTRLWKKRTRKIMFDATVKTPAGARKIAAEEIYEGKVGELEYKVTVADYGIRIKQNTMARLHIPEIGLSGEFFVVGARIQADANGFVQEVRLREKQYAISQRTPEDPKLVQTHAPSDTNVLTGLGQRIAATGNMPETWGDYFLSAAKEFNGPWDFDLFLATLIGIADQESHFRNVRESGSAEWSPPPNQTPQDTHRHGEDAPLLSYDEWCKIFANAAGNPNNPFNTRGHNAEAGVGPMQLTSAGLKNYADDHFRQGFRNEYLGGRWHPEHNIWGAARYLRECLKSLVRDSGRDVDIWMGVSAYNHGIGGASVGDSYSVSVKNKVLHTPGYLASVTAAVKAAREAAKASKDGSVTDAPWLGDDPFPSGLPTREQILVFFNQYSNPNFASKITKREAIVMAAMWGRYNRDQMHYSHSQPNDLRPPPNVPNQTDCSWFAHWCYKSAGATDPGTWTSPQWNSGKAISAAQLQPGDLVFYANPNSTSGHVAVYVGFGKVVSMGSEGGPWLVETRYRSDLAGFRSYL